jgi:exonuclease SbcD
MGFGEARQEKSVCLITFSGTSPEVRLVKVPVFQGLERVKGTWEEISTRILELSAGRSHAWLEVVYEGEEVIENLRDRLDETVSGSDMEILRIKNNRIIDRVLNRTREHETLDDLNAEDVFERCLSVHDVPENQRPDLLHTYREAVASLHEEDVQEA